MIALLDVDLTTAIAFPSPKEFDLAANTQDENGICAYILGRFVTKMKQQVEKISLDLLRPILPRTQSARRNTEYEDQDLGLLPASAIALAGQGSPKGQGVEGGSAPVCVWRRPSTQKTTTFERLHRTPVSPPFSYRQKTRPRLRAEYLPLTPSGRTKALLRQH